MIAATGMPRRASAFLVAMAFGALAVVTLAALLSGPPEDIASGRALLCLLAMAAAWQFPLRAAFKTKLTLDTSVIIAAALLLDPATAILVCLLGAAATRLSGRQTWDEAVFNAAQVALQTALAAGLLALAGWDAARPDFGDPRLVPALLAAGVLMALVNDLCLATMIALYAGEAPLRAWRPAGGDPVEWLAFGGQAGLGVVAAILFDSQPPALLAVALALVALHAALSRTIELRRQVEAGQAAALTSHAVAQRVGEIGSWEWDLATGEQIWSDETRRLLGLPSDAPSGSWERFLAGVHPDDREAVDRAVHAALRDGGRYRVEHRATGADGVERYLQQRGEVVDDADARRARLIGVVLDITEHRVQQARLAHQASHDPLTGLANRARFMERVEQALERPGRRRRFAVMFLDLDRFKQVNDTHGHDVGDQLLCVVAERLRLCVRPGDTVARLGGDEFTLLVEGISGQADAERLAERIATSLTAPITLGGRALSVTTSVGIALPTREHLTPGQLLRDADLALYHAKERGRARHAVFDAQMRAGTGD